MPEVLEWLLTRLNQIDVGIKRLYLDKQFYNVAVISHLPTHHPLLSVIIPVIIRGKYGGTRALVKGRKSYNTTYTMHSAEHGQATFSITVVCKYSKGRYLRRGIAVFAYALLGPGEIPLHQVPSASSNSFYSKLSRTSMARCVPSRYQKLIAYTPLSKNPRLLIITHLNSVHNRS